MGSLKLSQQSHSAGHHVIYNPENTYLFPTNTQLHSVQCHSLITAVWWLYFNALHLYTSPLNVFPSSSWADAGRGGLLFREDAVYCCPGAREQETPSL